MKTLLMLAILCNIIFANESIDYKAKTEKNRELQEYVDEELRSERESMIKAINKQGFHLVRNASKSLKKDKDFFYWLLKNDWNGSSFIYMDEKLLDDKDIMLEAVTLNRWIFKYASERLKKDRDVALNAVKTSSFTVNFVHKSLLSDKEIVLLGLKSKRGFLKNVDKTLLSDKEIIKKSLKYDPFSLKYASDKLKNDKEFILELMKINHYAYDDIGKSLLADKELALFGLKWNPDRLKNMDESLKDDPEVIGQVIERDIKYLQYASQRLRSDKTFIFSLMKHNADAIKYATEAFKNNKQIMLEAIKKNPLTYEWLSPILQEERDICLATVSHKGDLLKLLPKKYLLDKEMIQAAITNDGLALYYAPKIFREAKYIVRQAVKNNGFALNYASLELKKDKELIILARNNSASYNFIADNPVKREVHSDAWESYILEDTLELLYGKDANFTEDPRFFVTPGMKMETELSLKTIAVLQESKGRKNLIAWYIVHGVSPINVSVNIDKPGKYIVIAEGIDGKLYMNTNKMEEKYYGCGQAYLEEQEKYNDFFRTHLIRKVTQNENSTHLEFMIVNDTLDYKTAFLKKQEIDFITKVRIEIGGKTLFTMYTSEYLSKNPYFNIFLPNTKKDKITIFCTDAKQPKEYVYVDKMFTSN